MVLPPKIWRSRRQGSATMNECSRKRRPMLMNRSGNNNNTNNRNDSAAFGKIVVRLKPMTEEESDQGETLCLSAAPRGGEITLDLSNNLRGSSSGKQRYEQMVFEVDRAIGPACDNEEVYLTAATRLVDRAITGGCGLFLVGGTPGSGRSHTLWGSTPTTSSGTASCSPPWSPTSPPPASASCGGILPMALTDLARRWRFGDGSPFYASPHRFGPAASPLMFRLCAVELCGQGEATPLDFFGDDDDVGGGDCDELGEGGSETVKDLPSIPPPTPTSPRQSRWRLSAKNMLAAVASSSHRGSADCNDHDDDGDDGDEDSPGNGHRRDGVAPALLTTRSLAGVTEVAAEGVDEAVTLIRKSVESRRGDGHIVIAAKLVAEDRKRVPTSRRSQKATGELVFVEIGECSAGELPHLLRSIIARFKIGYRAPTAITGTCASPPRPRATVGDDGKDILTGGGPLWTLLDALSGRSQQPLSYQEEFPRKTMATASVVRGRHGGGLVRSARFSWKKDGVEATSEVVAAREWAGAVARQRRQQEPSPLVVSIVATLCSGDGYYFENKAVLEALAKSVSSRATAWTTQPLKRMLVSMPSFPRRSLWHAAATTSAAAVVGSSSSRSAAIPETGTAPSAPPLSGSCSYSSSSCTAFAVAAAQSGPNASVSTNNDKEEPSSKATTASTPAQASSSSSLPSSLSSSFSSTMSPEKASGREGSEAAAVVEAEAVAVSRAGEGVAATEVTEKVGLSASPDPAVSEKKRHGPAAEEGVARLDVGGREPVFVDIPSVGSGPCVGAGAVPRAGAGGGGEERPRSSFDGGRLRDGSKLEVRGRQRESWPGGSLDKDGGGTGAGEEEGEKRMSSPWDDSSLGLLDMTPDALVEKIVQAETALRYWKAQYAFVQSKLAAARKATACRPGTVPSTQSTDGCLRDSRTTTKSKNLQQALGREGDEQQATEGEPTLPTRTPRSLTPPSPASPQRKTSPPRSRRFNFGGMGSLGGGGSGGHGSGRRDSDGHTANGDFSRSPGTAEDLCRKVPPPVADTDAFDPSKTSPSQLTFMERRAIFCSNESSTTPLPGPVSAFIPAGGKTAAVAPPLWLRRVGSRTSSATLPMPWKPPDAALQSIHDETPVGRGRVSENPAQHDEIVSPPATTTAGLELTTTTMEECKEKEEPQVEKGVGGGVTTRVSSSSLSAEPVAAQPAHTASPSTLPSVGCSTTKSDDDHAVDASRFESFCSPSSVSGSPHSPAPSSSPAPSTPPPIPSPPAPSPIGTDSGGDGDSSRTPDIENSNPGAEAMPSPSIVSPPSLSRPSVDGHNGVPENWTAPSSPEIVVGEEPSKRDSNVWYGIWEGGHPSDELLEPGEGPESANGERFCGGEGRGSWYGGGLDSAGGRRRSWVKKGSGGGDGGIVASLAMASPLHWRREGSRSPPLSPEFARAMPYSSNAAPVLLRKDPPAAVPGPPSTSHRSVTVSPWSGITLRHKGELRRSISSSPARQVVLGERLRENRHPHGFGVQAASPGGSSTPGPPSSSASANFASAHASVEEKGSEAGGSLCDGGRCGGVSDLNVARQGSARPRGILVSSSSNRRNSCTDTWKERPQGFGPWPLFEPSSRESIIPDARGGERDFLKTSQEKDMEKEVEAPPGYEARLLVARAARAKGDALSHPDVLIENVTRPQSSKFWAVRAKLERRYSWARGTSSTKSNGAGPQDGLRERQKGPGEGQGCKDHSGQRDFATKPWGSGRGLTVSRKFLGQHGRSERFKLTVPP